MEREVAAPDGRVWLVKRRLRWPRWRLRDGSLPPFELDPTGLTLLLFLPLVLAAILVFAFSLVAVLVELVAVFVLGYLWRGRWIIEAATEGPPAEDRSWTLRGWRRSRRAFDEVVEELRAGAEAAPAEAERDLR